MPGSREDRMKTVVSKTSQDLFAAPFCSKEGLVVESLSSEFQNTGRDIAQLEKIIDELNLSGSCTDSGNAGCLYSWKVDCLIEMIGTVSSYGDIAKFTKIVALTIFGLAFIWLADKDFMLRIAFGEVFSANVLLDSITAMIAVLLGSAVVLVAYLRKVCKTRNVMQLREAFLLLRLREKYINDKAKKAKSV